MKLVESHLHRLAATYTVSTEGTRCAFHFALNSGQPKDEQTYLTHYTHFFRNSYPLCTVEWKFYNRAVDQQHNHFDLSMTAKTTGFFGCRLCRYFILIYFQLISRHFNFSVNCNSSCLSSTKCRKLFVCHSDSSEIYARVYQLVQTRIAVFRVVETTIYFLIFNLAFFPTHNWFSQLANQLASVYAISSIFVWFRLNQALAIRESFVLNEYLPYGPIDAELLSIFIMSKFSGEGSN